MNRRRWVCFESAFGPLCLGSLAGMGLLVVVLGRMGPAVTRDKDPMVRQIRLALEQHGDGVVAGIWVGSEANQADYSLGGRQIHPAASAIKTAFLIELYAKYAQDLDQIPSGLDQILVDKHPAISHFTELQRREIRRHLSTATARSIGRIMMGSEAATNIVYNAAANVTTALLGGPESLTNAIHARSPDFTDIVVRRYMLASRNVRGDNTASPAALAAVLHQIAMRQLERIDAATLDAIIDAILASEKRYGLAGEHHFKDGALDSIPLTRVQSGWWLPPEVSKPIVYVVMVEQPSYGGRQPSEAATRISQLSQSLTQIVLSSDSH